MSSRHVEDQLRDLRAMISAGAVLRCIECFMRRATFRPAEFVINGQSLCQSHVHFAVVEPGQPPKHYTWAPEGLPYNPHNEPLLVEQGRRLAGPDGH